MENTQTPAGAVKPTRLYAELPATVDGKVTLTGKFKSATDANYYNSPYYLAHQTMVQPFDATPAPVNMNLDSVLPAEAIAAIQARGEIVFHSVGDTGATTLTKFDNTESVAAMMAGDLSQADAPSFFFHLGDVIYNFGEEAYYYQQFYDAYQKYNGPIFAIPGNHDGMVYNATMKSLAAFIQNFCAKTPAQAPNASNKVRSTMDQPGVYFTLDAPFVSIVGLYSNVLDGTPGGMISSQQGKFPISDVQLSFLASEMARITELRKTSPRAIVLAVHHPPFSGDSSNGGSPLMVQDLTTAFTTAGVWPDIILSGHSHNYQRFTWAAGGKQIPCIIAGSGGFNMTPIPGAPSPEQFPYTIPGSTDLVMNNYKPLYGYLEITVNSGNRTLNASFNSPKTATQSEIRGGDSVTVTW